MIVGVDLHLKRPSIICILKNQFATFFESIDETVDIITLKPEMVIFDAPLSLELPFREFERKLMRRGYRFFPLSIKSMKELTKKAMRIKKELQRKGMKVFETHPGSLSKWINVNIEDRDKRDAFLCAFIGYLYIRGIAREMEGFLFL